MEGQELPFGWWIPDQVEHKPQRRRFREPLWGRNNPEGSQVAVFRHGVRVIKIPNSKVWRIDLWSHDQRKWVRERKGSRYFTTRVLQRALDEAKKIARTRGVDDLFFDYKKTFLAWVTPNQGALRQLRHPHAYYRDQGRTLWDYATWMAEHRPHEIERVRRIVAQALKKKEAA